MAPRPESSPLPLPEAAKLTVEDLEVYCTLQESGAMMLAAVSCTRRLSISFWDALVVEAAIQGGADHILTEDLQHGQVIAGVRVRNPFV